VPQLRNRKTAFVQTHRRRPYAQDATERPEPNWHRRSIRLLPQRRPRRAPQFANPFRVSKSIGGGNCSLARMRCRPILLGAISVQSELHEMARAYPLPGRPNRAECSSEVRSRCPESVNRLEKHSGSDCHSKSPAQVLLQQKRGEAIRNPCARALHRHRRILNFAQLCMQPDSRPLGCLAVGHRQVSLQGAPGLPQKGSEKLRLARRPRAKLPRYRRRTSYDRP